MIAWIQTDGWLSLCPIGMNETIEVLSHTVTFFPYETFCRISCRFLEMEHTRVSYGRMIRFMDPETGKSGRLLLENRKIQYEAYERKTLISFGKSEDCDFMLAEDYGSLRLLHDHFIGYHTMFGISHNGNLSNEGELNEGDELLFYPLVIRIEKDFILVSCCKKIMCRLPIFHAARCESVSRIKKEKEVIYGYDPSICRKTVIHLEKKENVSTYETGVSFLSFLPAVFMALSSLVVGILNGLRYETVDLLTLVASVLMPFCMLVSSILYPLLSSLKKRKTQQKKKREETAASENTFRQKEKEIACFIQNYRDGIAFLNEDNRQIVQTPRTLWCVVSDCQESLEIQSETDGICEGESLTRLRNLCHPGILPYAWNVLDYPTICICGEKRERVLQLLVEQITAHSTIPIVFLDEENRDRHFWLRTVSATVRNGRRCIFSSAHDCQQILTELNECVCVVFSEGTSDLTLKKGQICITVREKNDLETDLALVCKEKICWHDYRFHRHLEMDYRTARPAHSYMETPHIEAVILDHDFLSVHNAKRAEDLNIAEKYETENIQNSIRGILGVDEKGNEISLDLHEKKDGPHGIVAGMTGSGKSELLLSYVLSLAVSYSPKMLQFAFIDFKGGGLSSLLKDLPHTAGILSNLDTDCMERALFSFTRICTEREKLLLKMQECSFQPVTGLSDYRKNYRKEYGLPWLSDLVIIIDEFAELKKSRPEEMKELISIARIGRSLGIHMILCTQKPAGVINEEILSNCSFRIALKVAGKNDSYEIVNCNDASFFKNPGQFVLARDTQIQKGTGAYANTCVSKEKRSVAILKPDGSIQSDSRDFMPKGPLQLPEVLQEIRKHAEKCEQLWLPPLEQNSFAGFENTVFGLLDEYRKNRYVPLYLEKEKCFLFVSDDSKMCRETVKTLLFCALSDRKRPLLVSDSMPDFLQKREDFFLDSDRFLSDDLHTLTQDVLILHGCPFFEDHPESRARFMRILEKERRNGKCICLVTEQINGLTASMMNVFNLRTVLKEKNLRVIQNVLDTGEKKNVPTMWNGLLSMHNRIMEWRLRSVKEEELCMLIEKEIPDTSVKMLSYEGEGVALARMKERWLLADTYRSLIITACYPNDLYSFYSRYRDRTDCCYAEKMEEGICFMNAEQARKYLNEIPILLIGKGKDKLYGFIHDFRDLSDDQGILFLDYHSEVADLVIDKPKNPAVS